MSQRRSTANTRHFERRKRWHDRRVSPERRNPIRVSMMDDECRSSIPRRESDISGYLIEGDSWWRDDRKIV